MLTSFMPLVKVHVFDSEVFNFRRLKIGDTDPWSLSIVYIIPENARSIENI